MEKYYYFRLYNGRETKIVEFENPVDTNVNVWLRELTSEQRTFYLEHPYATIYEIKNCALTPPYIPPVPSIEELREQAISELDNYSRSSLGNVVDTLAFCDALAGTIYSQSRGIESIYNNDEILSTADNFLIKGKQLRDKYNQTVPLINAATTQDEINSIVESTKQEFDQIIQPVDDLEKHKRDKIREIEVYDISENVNGFFFNGVLLWLDKDTRTGLVNTLNSAVIVGRNVINIWFSGMYITLNIDEARQMLAALEIYATDCYNVTAQHKVDVMALETIEAVDAYDVTIGYPQRPEFNMNGNI